MAINDPRPNAADKSSTSAFFWAGSIFLAGVLLVLALMYGTQDRTGQSASMGTTPTEQVKAPPSGTASSTTTGTAPRNQEGR